MRFIDFDKDYYEILHIEPAASQDLIERVHVSLSEVYDPGLYPDDDRQFAEEMRELLGEAFRVLGDPDTRKRYDENRSKSFSMKLGADEGGEGSGELKLKKGILDEEFFSAELVHETTPEERAAEEHAPVEEQVEPEPIGMRSEKASLRHYLGAEGPEEHFSTGLQHYHAHEYDEAMKQFQIALVKDAGFTAAKYFLARSMMNAPNASRHRALALMKEAIRENPQIGNFSLEEKTEHFQLEVDNKKRRGFWN